MQRRIVTMLVAGGWFLIAAGQANAQAVTLATWTGTVTAPNSLNPQGTSTYADVKTISLQAGGSYIFANYSYQYSVNFTSGYNYDDYGYLLDPNNTLVAQDDDSNGNLQFKITYTPKVSGTFTCVITLWSPYTNTKMQYQVIVTGPSTGAITPGSGIPYVRLEENTLGGEVLCATGIVEPMVAVNNVAEIVADLRFVCCA